MARFVVRRLLLLVPVLAACGSSNDSSGSSAGGDAPKTLTYWASNQGASLDVDKQVLQPELDKFEKQTGIKVNLEVIGWNDLVDAGSRAEAARRGLQRLEGKSYEVQDGDVLNVRFNV